MGVSVTSLVAEQVSGLPIVDAGRVVGVIAEADVLTNAKSKSAKDAMTADTVTICGGAGTNYAKAWSACRRDGRSLGRPRRLLAGCANMSGAAWQLTVATVARAAGCVTVRTRSLGMTPRRGKLVQAGARLRSS